MTGPPVAFTISYFCAVAPASALPSPIDGESAVRNRRRQAGYFDRDWLGPRWMATYWAPISADDAGLPVFALEHSTDFTLPAACQPGAIFRVPAFCASASAPDHARLISAASGAKRQDRASGRHAGIDFSHSARSTVPELKSTLSWLGRDPEVGSAAADQNCAFTVTGSGPSAWPISPLP